MFVYQKYMNTQENLNIIYESSQTLILSVGMQKGTSCQSISHSDQCSNFTSHNVTILVMKSSPDNYINVSKLLDIVFLVIFQTSFLYKFLVRTYILCLILSHFQLNNYYNTDYEYDNHYFVARSAAVYRRGSSRALTAYGP